MKDRRKLYERGGNHSRDGERLLNTMNRLAEELWPTHTAALSAVQECKHLLFVSAFIPTPSPLSVVSGERISNEMIMVIIIIMLVMI